MWADLTGPLPERTTDLLVAPAHDVATWYSIFAAGFELPEPVVEPLRRLSEGAAVGPLRNLLAAEDGVPVGTASLVIAGDVVGLYNITVRHEDRGCGLGRDITIAAMAAARAAGCATAVLTATPSGLPVYRRLGFADAGPRAIYVPPVP
jgi:predicted N-acetyltransferase YhbS